MEGRWIGAWGAGAIVFSPAVFRCGNNRKLKLITSGACYSPLHPCLIFPTRQLVPLDQHFFSPSTLLFAPGDLFLLIHSQVIACGVPVGFPVGPVVELVRQVNRVTIHDTCCLSFGGITPLFCRSWGRE